MKQIDSRTNMVKVYKASKTKRSTDPYPGLSFMTLDKRANYELPNLSEKNQGNNPGLFQTSIENDERNL